MRSSIIRFSGWMLLKKRVSSFRKDAFPLKLQEAGECLRMRRAGPCG
ncbi:MAG: hypothetical protein ACYC5N_00430 [Endomicrobiales bacterium]